jgi:hypothetical protein
MNPFERVKNKRNPYSAIKMQGKRNISKYIQYQGRDRNNFLEWKITFGEF